MSDTERPKPSLAHQKKVHLFTAVEKLFLYDKGTYGHRDAKVHLANKIEELCEAIVEEKLTQATQEILSRIRRAGLQI